ncbi:PAS domain S-box protein [bacterium]|nr:MAG: PAS domain S-box protein [bacterium]
MENTPLKVLCLEDSPRDVELMRELLVEAGYDLNMDCTAVEKEFAAMLGSRAYDIILADFKLPGFDAFAALRWAMDICPNVPFICVSGSIGEETAVEILKKGAVDYILKDKLARLPSAIDRAVREAKEKEARQRAEEALRASEFTARRRSEELEKLMDLAPIAIWVANDPQCMQITGNRTANAFYESEQNENVSAGPEAGLHDTTRRFFQNGRELKPEELPMQEAAAKGVDIRNSELEVLSPSGRRFTMLGNASPLWDEEGRVRGCVGSFVDITERKRAEETLQKSEKQLREAQEMAHLGFWNWDVKTGEVEWSEEVFKIFCLDPKSFTPHIDSILALSPWPEDHQRDQELIKRAIETHSPGAYEQKFLRPDRSIGHYYSTFHGVYDEKGELISIVGTVLDITERKRAEEKILHQLEELKRWQEVTLGREDRVRQLKTEVNQLLSRLGETIRYPSQESVNKE